MEIPITLKWGVDDLLGSIHQGGNLRIYPDRYMRHMGTLERGSPLWNEMDRLLDAYALAVGESRDSVRICNVLRINRAEYNKLRRAGAIPGTLKEALQNYKVPWEYTFNG